MRKALLVTLVVFSVVCMLYLWLPYRVAVVQLFFRLGGSRLLIPAEYGSLDAPRYLPVSEVSAYPASMEVLGLELNGEAKAIPVKRIAWHLVVNDQFGGESVVFTHCTVSDAALAYRATAGQQRLDFAPAGLERNNLVMRDRQTGSCWQQFTGRAIQGPLAGTALTQLPVVRMSLANWRARHPTGVILEPAGNDCDCCAPNDTCPVMSYYPSRPFLVAAAVAGRRAVAQKTNRDRAGLRRRECRGGGWRATRGFPCRAGMFPAAVLLVCLGGISPGDETRELVGRCRGSGCRAGQSTRREGEMRVLGAIFMALMVMALVLIPVAFVVCGLAIVTRSTAVLIVGAAVGIPFLFYLGYHVAKKNL